MARLKSYYTADEITNDLYTFGKEFMTQDNVEYIGPYHRYATGETYTEFQWNPRDSVRLVAYRDLAQPTMQYRKLKNFSLSTIAPKQVPCTINKNDIRLGFVTRYFINKVNQLEVFEIDSEQYAAWQSGRIDKILYVAIELTWRIAGNLNDVVEKGITKPGVITQNQQTLIAASQTIPNIINTVTNLTEFYTDADFVIPKDINGLDN